MFEETAPLQKIHIKNFLSLRDVELPLKRLTVLVGPNASGKSNVLRALQIFPMLIASEEPPTAAFIRDRLWAGDASSITFQLQAKVQETPSEYIIDFKTDGDNLLIAEALSVEDVKVISIKDGKGTVQDENGRNETTYKSKKLALKSAGDYGNKPVTSALTDYIGRWRFYDFQPDIIRSSLSGVSRGDNELSEVPKLDRWGGKLSEMLSYWHSEALDRFQSVSESLAACTNIKLAHSEIGRESPLYLLEGFKKHIPLSKASDGTLRLIAYYALLNESELPPLIAVEEPERSLHPGALAEMSDVLEQLSERTQVVITTHSSQLLDAFDPESLSESLGILLLRNPPGRGTEVINLEDIRGNRPALDGWITDFGIGSAIFHSELLPESMEESG